MNWESGHRHLNTNDEWWELTPLSVSWEEAFKAGLEGKKIKPVEILTFPDYEDLAYVLEYLSKRKGCYDKIMMGKWYIE